MSNYNNQPPGNQPQYNYGDFPPLSNDYVPKHWYEHKAVKPIIVILIGLIIVVGVISVSNHDSRSAKTVLCEQLQKTEQDTLNGASGQVLYADGFTLGTDAQKAGGQYLIDVEEFASAANSGVPVVGNPGLIALENACR
jgi:hypothetical protein